ncbi:unnamed protein product [Commensalibacter papalotli (ex Botero et al. 2024)]|uniref:Uncharacterized protein n=1 Tax=Commensalibacter papalotli (ex Botero et al. 2024) TaxID=2972766 RepID=A0ABM9HK56_9PROT|nr:unnamed protein product [Commensalibacter papalotli (ex Botero et al. 2024)]CAI3929883.1 unnamed protein product [Commensalibacter papalotli (ex Botero et al. 2024)]
MALFKKINSFGKKIRSDWQNALKNYQKYKTLQHIKRNGPFLTGIYL